MDYVAEKVGCYKVSVSPLPLHTFWTTGIRSREKRLADPWDALQSILDCSEANEGFYVKCGFKRAGLEMAHYYEAPKTQN